MVGLNVNKILNIIELVDAKKSFNSQNVINYKTNNNNVGENSKEENKLFRRV